MGAFVRLRAQRRLSGWIVVAFLVLGVISAGHHHALAASDEAADCVVCRAADPVRIVLPDVVVPDVVLTSVVTPELTEPTHSLPFPRFSPRAPPVAA